MSTDWPNVLKAGLLFEPEIDDEQWEEHMIAEAKEVSSWRKLLAMVTIGKKWRKRVKSIFSEKPPKGITPNLSSAAVLCATWFDLNEWIIGEKIAHSRNLRFAARLRGALASLRELLVMMLIYWFLCICLGEKK